LTLTGRFRTVKETLMTRRPSVFLSHGAPTFALEPGQAGPQLAALALELPRPQAVLLVSPHWMTSDPTVSLTARPETIHDFGGFGPALHQIQYAAPGHPALASRTIEVLRQAGWSPRAHETRGLDHGAWVPMRHMYPAADVPVFQVSLPSRLDADGAWMFGRALAPLADEGVLIVGSGSLTHNLSEFMHRAIDDAAYVHEFSAWVRDAVIRGDGDRLRRTLIDAPHARRAHPTPEHFLPLLVAAGAAVEPWTATAIEGGVTHGVLSMDGFVFHSGASPTA
jgi:4,5-DOPA dioxygenase extradiol